LEKDVVNMAEIKKMTEEQYEMIKRLNTHVHLMGNINRIYVCQCLDILIAEVDRLRGEVAEKDGKLNRLGKYIMDKFGVAMDNIMKE
jgi:hypothetical protein